jgi:hypothetical protein
MKWYFSMQVEFLLLWPECKYSLTNIMSKSVSMYIARNDLPSENSFPINILLYLKNYGSNCRRHSGGVTNGSYVLYI